MWTCPSLPKGPCSSSFIPVAPCDLALCTPPFLSQTLIHFLPLEISLFSCRSLNNTVMQGFSWGVGVWFLSVNVDLNLYLLSCVSIVRSFLLLSSMPMLVDLWGLPSLWLLQIKLLWKVVYWICMQIFCHFSWVNIWDEMKRLVDKWGVPLTFKEPVKLFSNGPLAFHIPIISVGEFQLLHKNAKPSHDQFLILAF